ncbi:MAG: signal peptide peptidase SppA, partial [bacterium]
SFAMDNVALGNFRKMNEDGDHLSSVGSLHLTSSRQLNLFNPKPHQMVEVELSGELLESEPPFSLFGKKGKTLFQLCKEIQHYTNDPKVDGLILFFDNPKLGLSQAQQLRRYLEGFRDSGKKLIAYSEDYSQRDYYLASLCDEIYLMPVGSLDLKGLAAVLGYLKGTMDKLGVQVQVARVRDYKTAANSFAYEGATEAEAEMFNWLLDDIYEQMCSQIAAGRNLGIDEFKEMVDAGPYYGQRALKVGLVDSLIYYDKIKIRLEDDDFVVIAESDYWKLPEYKEEWPDIRTPKVAIIYAERAIVSGESGSNPFSGRYMGSKTIADAIRKAREDKSIDAIILRVDSPGGSAVASEAIYREVQRTVTSEENRKPFIVSMGNVAGSGGYYIACGADTIVAEEGTITGSIGVLGLKFNLAGLHKKIYYNTSTFKRGEHSDAWSLSRPLTEAELDMMQEAVESIYDDFTSHVSADRGIQKDELNTIAEGRVWTGKQAQERGLVDLLGGLDVAPEVTKARLGLTEYEPVKLEFYPEPPGFLVGVLTDIAQLGVKPLPKIVSEALEPVVLIAECYDGEPLMLMPYEIEIK